MKRNRCKEGYPQDTCNKNGFKCPYNCREEQKECGFYSEFSTNKNEEVKE